MIILIKKSLVLSHDKVLPSLELCLSFICGGSTRLRFRSTDMNLMDDLSRACFTSFVAMPCHACTRKKKATFINYRLTTLMITGAETGILGLV
jgi:hypothetical protein